MKTVSFSYVRHGQTDFNRDGVIQGGRVDAPLASESLPAVRAAAEALADVPFARAYRSPLGRAAETARILCAPHEGLAAEPLDDLREFDFGRIDGLPYDGNRLRFAAHFLRQDFSDLGGEAGSAARARVRRAFERMFAASDDGDEVLVVAHGALMRYLLLEFWPKAEPWRKIKSRLLKTPNAGIAHVTGASGGFVLDRLPQSPELYERRPRHYS